MVPNACRAESHVASSGDVAVIAMSGTGAPSVSTTDVLYISAMASVNGGAFSQLNTVTAAEAVSDGTAHATIDLRYPLQAGKTYVFGSGFASNHKMTISPGWCAGVVTIVRS